MPVSTQNSIDRTDAVGVNITGTHTNGINHEQNETYDLICVGFGPASLAIAVALHDKGTRARVLYLERQHKFRWHSGMLLPETRMQISFIKDLATLRDPRSHFTFLNYLKSQNRLVAFTNLSTFLPLREEFNDYLTWCASHFERDVRYGQETLSVNPQTGPSGLIESWNVLSRDRTTGVKTTLSARRVVIAIGGKPKVPTALFDPSPNSPIVHSSSYSHTIPGLLASSKRSTTYSVAIVGGGQSAAEIFHDLQTRFSGIFVTLFTGDTALRPSDDSPFVNEIFDPSRVSEFYDLPGPAQKDTLHRNKATNYGVVRLELLDRLYEMMYHQRLHEPDESRWAFKIVPQRVVVGHVREESKEGSGAGRVRLRVRDTLSGVDEEVGGFDLVITATGYARDGHERILGETRDLLQTGKFDVGRDYKVRYREGTVQEGCGIWLQGCCENSHGLSDTLLSILAVRGGKMVDFLFPPTGTQPVNGTPAKTLQVNGTTSKSMPSKAMPANGTLAETVHSNGI